MGAYSCRVPILIWVLTIGEVVVVIELGAYIHGVLTFNGCLLSRFYGIYIGYLGNIKHAVFSKFTT